MPNLVSKERLYTDESQTQIVPENSPKAAYLLVAKGGEITEEMQKQYKLSAKLLEKPKAAAAAEDESDDSDEETEEEAPVEETVEEAPAEEAPAEEPKPAKATAKKG